ncbi:hypothetical protein [Fodinicola acaciae]|uniref:hypothetical protein n=1 Tax=Fodinicola acaciae TaxID=2681555 RepID=UPI0013D1A020|nr:hypothetical protein [Fodinicola acaciae]
MHHELAKIITDAVGVISRAAVTVPIVLLVIPLCVLIVVVSFVVWAQRKPDPTNDSVGARHVEMVRALLRLDKK